MGTAVLANIHVTDLRIVADELDIHRIVLLLIPEELRMLVSRETTRLILKPHDAAIHSKGKALQTILIMHPGSSLFHFSIGRPLAST